LTAGHEGVPPPPDEKPADETKTISGQEILSNTDESVVSPKDIPPEEKKLTDDVEPGGNISANGTAGASETPPEAETNPPVDWDAFTDRILQTINTATLKAGIKEDLIEHLKWMITQRWQPEFIERTITYSIQMEKDAVFFPLPEVLDPNKWFLVPKANKRIYLVLRHHNTNQKAPAATYDLWETKCLQLLRATEDIYDEFLKNNGLGEIEGKLMSKYLLYEGAEQADGDVFNWLIADIIYPRGTKFRVQKSHTQEDVTTVLRKMAMTPEQVGNFLAAKYAFAQGMMRHIKEFPGRSGNEVSVYRRLWPHEESPSFIGERHRVLFDGHMKPGECQLDAWDAKREALHTQFPTLLAEDGTLLGENGLPAQIGINFSDSYPVQSFSLVAPAQKGIMQRPGGQDWIEVGSFGCMTSETKMPIYAIFEPRCFRQGCISCEREFMLLAMEYKAKVSLFKSNQAYNEAAAIGLSQQYPDINFQTVQ
jgi:hypothetical protein